MKNFKIFIPLIILLLVSISLFFYNNKKNKDDKILVVASFYPVYFVTSQIGGDLIELKNLTPDGLEPHDYELTTGDLIEVRKSDLLVINGGGVESWENKVPEIKGNSQKVIVLANELGNEGIKNDPHYWLSPRLMIKEAEKISLELSRIDPKNHQYYNSNLDILRTKLTNLDNLYKKELLNCKKRDIVTSHEAFGYLTRDYDLKQVSIAGLSSQEEPSLEKMVEITNFAKGNDIKYIFFESLVSPELSEAIAREIGAQTLVLNPIEGFTNEEIGRGENYFTAVDKNLNNLKIALECE